MNSSLHIYFIYVLLFTTLFSCDKKQEKNRLSILCTTNILGDAVKNIVRDSAEVNWFMGPGVDPHFYKASQGDIQKLQQADIVFYNGLKLEGKMDEIFQKMKSQKQAVFPAAENGIPKEKIIYINKDQTLADPHIWFDVSMWVDVVQYIAQEMQNLDPKSATYYKANAKKYLADLQKVHNNILKKMENIPVQQRVLITTHDAFHYFGNVYQIKVMGLQGISTVSGLGLKRVTEVVDFIINNKIKSVFVERSTTNKYMDAVIEGCNEKGYPISIGGNLYTDTMGKANTPEGTYTGMIEYNVNTIFNALK